MDSLFAYRPAGDTAIHCHTGDCLEGLLEGGFALGTFDGRMYTIRPDEPLPFDSLNGTLGFLSRKETGLYYMPYRSTTQEAYDDGLNRIIDSLGAEEKTVYSRVITRTGHIDAEASFKSLCEAYPEAFVFCVSTPDTGTWIGATPEILLQGNGTDKFRSMALAGTRKRGVSEPWDGKNIVEHRIVADYIADILERHYLEYEPSETTTRPAGPIEHLCKEFLISGLHPADRESFREFITDLYPTPALCGFPKEKAMRMILDTEQHTRGLYGGFCGSLDGYRSDLNVVVRAVRFHPDRLAMFAGGGITDASNPEEEWIETERKADSILSKLVISKQ